MYTMVKLERLGVVLRPEHPDQAKFNAGMIEYKGTVHMLYRFSEKREKWHGRPIDWLHTDGEFPYVKNYICYAQLNTDGSLRKDTENPVLFPQSPEIVGCEDPRIVRFEGSFYIFYCSYDNRKPRVAVAKTADFETYEKLGIIDQFTGDKDAFIFPERIDGKIAYMHRIEPNIQLDYFDSFEQLLDPESWEGYRERMEKQTVLRTGTGFEAKKVGGGVPPIRTERGWLLFYHAVDANSKYHLGAALLDLNNPSVVKAKLPYPVLSPEADFETTGDYTGCVFAQGYFINDGYVYLSYGTADKYTALARVRLNEVLDELGRYPIEPLIPD